MFNYVNCLRVLNYIVFGKELEWIEIVMRLFEYDVKGGRMLMSVVVFVVDDKSGKWELIVEWEIVMFCVL